MEFKSNVVQGSLVLGGVNKRNYTVRVSSGSACVCGYAITLGHKNLSVHGNAISGRTCFINGIFCGGDVDRNIFSSCASCCSGFNVLSNEGVVGPSTDIFISTRDNSFRLGGRTTTRTKVVGLLRSDSCADTLNSCSTRNYRHIIDNLISINTCRARIPVTIAVRIRHTNGVRISAIALGTILSNISCRNTACS